jgi:hypothetical protein
MMPSSDWRITSLLCDSAQVADGKLFILGGGWSVCGPGPFLHGLAIKVDVPWNAANEKHQLTAELVHQDGPAVTIGDPPEEVKFGTDFEVGRPAGLITATPLDVPLAVNFGPMELPPGEMYSWRMSIDGTEITRVNFQTRRRP